MATRTLTWASAVLPLALLAGCGLTGKTKEDELLQEAYTEDIGSQD